MTDAADIDRLVARVLAGDLDAFEGIVEATHAAAWRAVAPLLFDRERTQDLVQDAFVQAYARLRDYTPGTSFVAWLATIARNRARNEVRGEARGAARLRAYRELVLSRAPDDEARVRDEWGRALAACRQQLPENSRELVARHYDQAQPLETIARAMGRTVEAVRQALWRIRVALRDCVKARAAAP